MKPGWQCIDVGANFGYFTVLLADLVGLTGHVEAWEPSEELQRCLAHTLELSGMRERVTPMHCAAGHVAGSAFLCRQGNDYASAVVRGESEDQDAEQVPMHPLASTRLKSVDFVKLDAEGMEFEAWVGLGDIRPKAALIEWTPSRYESPAAFMAMLRSQGYTIGRVNSAGDVDGPGDDLLEVKGTEMLWVERSA